MNGWSAGYVTDITYVTGWYRQQSPAMMALACLMGSVDVRLPAADDPLQVLELGCGQGFGAMILAASNPAWHVTAVDFNPAHVAAARLWAAEAELTNVTFIEADLATLAEDTASRLIPEADFVTLHGVWSWVPRSVQDGIVRLLRNKVRAGGVVHVSYNALPAWGPVLGMQRVMREAGRRLAWRSDRQAEEGLAIIQSLLAAEARQLNQSSLGQSLIGRLDKMPAAYLAHEYMNEHWQPCFMADVAGALADAKLDFVASSQLVENFPDLLLTEPQRAVVQKFEDPIMRETIKDLCVERALRHDVYVRGAQRLDPASRDAALADVRIGLNIHPDDLPLEVQMPAGKAELNPDFYQPIVRAASKGPSLIKDLLALPEIVGRRRNPAELVGMLVGLEMADLVARPESEPGTEAMRFNSVTARRFVRSENLTRVIALASRRTGAGVATSLLDLIVLERLRAGQTDMEALLRQINPDPEHVDQVRQTLDDSLNKRMSFLRGAGVF
ncbi:class I SAM-dependent methyltransferase [Acidisphaera sp. S103]|uniref:class I SAM-dependent methyltransferase n=1 Tax=Acidisphaera sp. S103 TaxID=1747223 RepID=UPI00131E1E7B|nr:class I SAM-dependent methyltransferase [Acidisphaera sp. S103]